MRRILTLSVLLLLISTSPAWAIFSFGVHGGFDLNAEDAHTIGDAVLNDGTFVSIERDEIQSPLMGGVHLRFGALPIVDLELGVEVGIRQYHVLYMHLDELSAEIESFDEDAYFGRISGYASGKINLINLPMVKGYAGGGVGYHVIAPLISYELLKHMIEEEDLEGEELDPIEILAKEGTMGGHLLAGVSFKPAFLPLILSVEGRYTMLPENDYGDETNRFMSIVFGIDLGF
jgi:hypothetical protein